MSTTLDQDGTDIQQDHDNENYTKIDHAQTISNPVKSETDRIENSYNSALKENKDNETVATGTEQNSENNDNRPSENRSETGSTEANVKLFDSTRKPKWEFVEDDGDGDKYVDMRRVSVVYRGGWGARMPTSREPLALPVTTMLYLATDTASCNTTQQCSQVMLELQTKHMDEMGMPDIQYNFVIGGDGNIYEGRGWYTNATKDEKNAYLEGKTYDIGFIGTYNGGDANYPFVAKPLATLLHDAVANKLITDVIKVYPIQQDRLPRDEQGRPVPVATDMRQLFKITGEPMRNTSDDDKASRLGEQAPRSFT